MKKHCFWRLGVIGMSAISGIEVALWDILGKHSRFRSGGCSAAGARPGARSIRISASATCARSMKPMDRRRRSSSARTRFVANGYRAIKVVFIPYTHYTPCCRRWTSAARMMAALRDAVGPRHRDHGRFPRPPGFRRARRSPISTRSTPARPMFVEEVLPPGDSRACARSPRNRAFRSPPASVWSIAPNSTNCFAPAPLASRSPTSAIAGACGGQEDRRDGGGRGDRRRSRTIRLGRLPASPRCTSPCRRRTM